MHVKTAIVIINETAHKERKGFFNYSVELSQT